MIRSEKFAYELDKAAARVGFSATDRDKIKVAKFCIDHRVSPIRAFMALVACNWDESNAIQFMKIATNSMVEDARHYIDRASQR